MYSDMMTEKGTTPSENGSMNINVIETSVFRVNNVLREVRESSTSALNKRKEGEF